MGDAMQAMRGLALRVGNMLARGRVSSVNAGTRMQTLQLQLLDQEVKDRLEHFEPYGLTSHPQAGAEAVAAFLDGDRSHGVVLVVADRRFRRQGLAAGEVALHDDLGQKVHLTRAGIVIDGGGLPITVTNTPTVTMQCDLHVTGAITADGTVTAPNVVGTTDVSFGGKSGVNHVHGNVQHGSDNTSAPV